MSFELPQDPNPMPAAPSDGAWGMPDEGTFESNVKSANAVSAFVRELHGDIVENKSKSDYGQWVIGPNSSFRPTGMTVPELKPAVYKVRADNQGIFFQILDLVTDDLVVLPGSVADKMLPKMQKFWASKDRYADRGLLYKKGAILYGPPGSGKSADLIMLMKQLIGLGGIVVVCEEPALTTAGLQIIRKIEPERNIIVVYEDIDEMIERRGDHDLLSLLDGEDQISNVLNIATTNYIDRLEARIANRPGRFDLRFFVDMPNADARRVYLQKTSPEMDEATREKWIKDTHGFSIAHLRELTSSVMCMDEDYEESLERLKDLRVRPKDKNSGFDNKGEGVGFSLGK